MPRGACVTPSDALRGSASHREVQVMAVGHLPGAIGEILLPAEGLAEVRQGGWQPWKNSER